MKSSRIQSLILLTAFLIAGCENKTFSTDAEAYVTRGFANLRNGQYDQAIAEFTNALQINPNFAEAYTARGLAYERKNQTDQAITDFTNALETNPKYAEAHYNRGIAYGTKKRQYDQAIADFTKALEITRHLLTPIMRGDLLMRAKTSTIERLLTSQRRWRSIRLLPWRTTIEVSAMRHTANIATRWLTSPMR